MNLLLFPLLLILPTFSVSLEDSPVIYNGTIHANESVTHIFEVPFNQTSTAVRVTVVGENVSEEYPLLTVFKQNMDVLSFPVPLRLNNFFSFNRVSRTLCPSYISSNKPNITRERILVDLSSSIEDPNGSLSYLITLEIIKNFKLNIDSLTSVVVSPSEPQYFLFSFPDDVDSVIVKITSGNALCMTVSVQAAKCPVSDLLGNVKFSGIYQTVTTLGAITVTRAMFNSDFFVILVLKPSDLDCGGPAFITPSRPIPQTVLPESRSKNVTISVLPTLAGKHYILPVFGAFGIYSLFYIAAAVIILVYQNYSGRSRTRLATPLISSQQSPNYSHYFPNSQPPTSLFYPSSTTSRIIGQTSTKVSAPRSRHKGTSFATLNSVVLEEDCGIEDNQPYSCRRNERKTTTRSLFSSSSDEEGSTPNLIRMNSKRSDYKKRMVSQPLPQQPRPSVPEVPAGDASTSWRAHRRSVSYGSTREMRPISLLVGERFSTFSQTDINREQKPLAEASVSVEEQQFGSTVKLTEDMDVLSDAETDRQVYLLNRYLYVSDLSRKRYSTLDRKYLLYFWYLIIISIFYGLPVAQLVMTYQRALHDTGNEDICYYNFECAHPFGVFTAFNNIISNIGYVMLGLLFLGLTARRDIIHRRSQKYNIICQNKFGIPQHYGLFYAMGLALTMEGVLSACYHICPSFSNFQFDTAYMYILALILMLKIYQTRHPDINASAHAAYMVMAVIILLGVTGVLYGGETFWVLFTVTFLIMSIWITAEVYYMGQWSFDICLPRRLYYLMRSDGIQCLTPMYLERMLLLLTANCVNIGMATYGIFTRPNDFSSFLLSIFMINLLMYYCFYIIMKLRHHEHLLCVPLIYIILSCVTWGSAIYFFIQHSTTWEVSPAQSRALNRPCLMLDFYDDHDVWHFLSSTSMFFSFMSIMTLDDDLVKTPRNEIPVF